MSISITNLIEASTAAMNQMQAMTQQKVDLLGKLDEAVDADKATLDKVAANTKITETARLDSALASQERNLTVGDIFGTNASKANAVYAKLAAEASTAFEIQKQAKSKIDAKLGASLFNDPLGYIMGRLTVNEDIAAHNSAVDAREMATKRIQELNQLTESSAQVQRHFAAPVTLASRQAVIDNIAMEASLKKSMLDREGIRYNVQAVDEAMRLPAQQIQNLFQLKSAQNADEGLALQRQAAARAAQSQALAERRQQLLESKEAEAESTVLQMVDAGRALRGLPPLTGLQTKQVFNALRSKVSTPFAAELQYDYAKGQELAFRGGKEVKIADSPSEYLSIRESGINFNHTPATQAVVTRLVEVKDAVLADPKLKAAMGANKNPKASASLIDGAINEAFKADMASAKIGTGDSIYSINSIQDLAKAVPEIAANPVYTKVLKARLDAGENFDTPTKVMVAVREGVRAGVITINDAAKVSEIFAKGVEINNQTKQFSKFGLPEATGLTAKLDTRPGMFGGNKVYNIVQPDQVMKYVMDANSTRSVQEQLSAVPIVGAATNLMEALNPALQREAAGTINTTRSMFGLREGNK